MSANGGPGGGNSGPGGGGNSGQGGGGGNPGQGGGNPGGERNAQITVDNHTKVARAGDWEVSALKAKVGVDAAKVLAEITPTGIVDLEDTAHIDVQDGMRFMSHARKGGSS